MILPSAPASAEYRIDFARWAGVPLLKTKFGVYETPFVKREELVRSLDLVREIGVRNLRYELAWGKPDAEAFDMVGLGGIDFGFVDAMLDRCRAHGIRPLLANAYCPLPLQSGTGWPAWKAVPKDLVAWGEVNRAFAAHLSGRGARYEVWNEPDMPEGGGKMFFSGSPEDYGQVYRAAAEGIRAGDPDAAVGGPAAAYDLRYLTPVLAGDADFASIHGYANYPTQIAGMRKALAARPDLPILLTEYASFNDFRKDGPAVRTEAAAAFFRDADGLLGLTDVATVYWAQWIDDYLGLVARDGHRRALFNAFKAYGAMPTDRVEARSNGPSEGLTVLASSSGTESAVVVTNPTGDDRTVTLRLANASGKGAWRLSRIDHHHASFVDDPSTEALTDETLALRGVWTGVVPAQGVVFLRVGHPETARRPPEGRIVRERYHFADRGSRAYADFDPADWTARLGGGAAQIGVEVEGVSRFRLIAKGQGSFTTALRVAFPGHGASVVAPTKGIVDLRRLAPPGWDGRRAMLTFMVSNASESSHARIALVRP